MALTNTNQFNVNLTSISILLLRAIIFPKTPFFRTSLCSRHIFEKCPFFLKAVFKVDFHSTICPQRPVGHIKK